MTELNSRLHVPPDVDPKRVSPVFVGPSPDADETYASIKPIRYRYVMAYLHDTLDADKVTVHKAGEVYAVLPMTAVSYSVGIYSGTEMSGTVYLPDVYLDLMPHQPLNSYERRPHPEQSGMPIGAMFECGNRAVYVMRNEKVVWGGILWTRSYTSGNPTLGITCVSWDAYAYYRAVRLSVVFNAPTNVYKIWYAVLKQMLMDSTWTGPNNGLVKDGVRHPDGQPKVSVMVQWTGLTLAENKVPHMNAQPRSATGPVKSAYEAWPNNVPKIDLPPADLKWMKGSPAKEVVAKQTDMFRGYDMPKVGEALQQWADTETIPSVTSATSTSLSKFEYRVVCWFDSRTQKFRQRYVFGEMNYSATPGQREFDNEPTVIGIKSEFFGTNTKTMVDAADNKLVFDFPGQISEWSLNESMEEAATRVIATDNLEAAEKHAVYSVQDDLLGVPKGGKSTSGSRGWLLYDRTVSFDTSITLLGKFAPRVRDNGHVPQAMQIDDLGTTPPAGQRTSYKSTDLSVTLYQDPTTVSPSWGIGDWAVFAIEDPFYGGKMYLQRRIIGYTVTVLPDQESDYSHEQITLELTDETRITES